MLQWQLHSLENLLLKFNNSAVMWRSFLRDLTFTRQIPLMFKIDDLANAFLHLPERSADHVIPWLEKSLSLILQWPKFMPMASVVLKIQPLFFVHCFQIEHLWSTNSLSFSSGIELHPILIWHLRSYITQSPLNPAYCWMI